MRKETCKCGIYSAKQFSIYLLMLTSMLFTTSSVVCFIATQSDVICCDPVTPVF